MSEPARKAPTENMTGVVRLWWGVLLLALLRLGVAMAEGVAVRPFYDSDALYLPALFQDLVAGGTWSTWKLPHTPYYFPDMGLYFLLQGLLDNFHASVLAFAVVQVLLLLLVTRFVARAMHGPDPALSVLSLAVVTALLFALGSGVDPLHMALMSVTHFGAFLMLLAALGGVVACWRVETESERKRWLLFLFLLTLLALASDFIFLLQFVLPMSAILLLMALLGAPKRNILLQILGTLLAGSAAGWGVFLAVVQQNTLDSHTDIDFSRMGWVGEWLRQLPGQHPWGVTLWLLFCAGLLRLAWNHRRERGLELAIPLFWLLSFGVTLAGFMTKDQVIYRYILPVIFVPLFVGWPLLLPLFPRWRGWLRHPRFAQGGVVMAAGVGLWMAPALAGVSHLPRLLEYTTPLSRCLDQLVDEHKLVNGLGDYWDAKSTSMLSRRGVSVVQVLPNLMPYHHINNLQWYNRLFQFVVINPALPPEGRISEQVIQARFGPPVAIARCDGKEVLIYRRPEDKEFQEQFTGMPSFLHIEKPGDTITLHPIWMASENGMISGNGRVATSPQSKEGLLIAGLGFELPSEVKYLYRVFFVSQGVEERSPGFLSLVREQGGERSETKVVDFPGKGAGAVGGVLTVPQGVKTDLQVYYKGEGLLSIPFITIEYPKAEK